MVGGDDGDATATVMDGDGRCDGNATAMTVMERGGDGGGAPTSNGRHRGMLAHYVRESVHLELSSFGYKYGAPPHCSREGFTYACPLLPLGVRDLDCAPGHVSKFNGLSYNEDVYGDDEWGGTTTTKAKKDGEGHSLMRRRADNIADEIIKVLVESRDEGGHGPVSPLTMTVSVRNEYETSVVLVEHLGRFIDDTGANSIVRHPVSMGTRHS